MAQRKDILKKLISAGFTFQQGGSHTRAYDRDDILKATIGMHSEIPEMIARKIDQYIGGDGRGASC